MTTNEREVFTREKVLKKLGNRDSFFASLDATQFELQRECWPCPDCGQVTLYATERLAQRSS
jgi:hypothetical protein